MWKRRFDTGWFSENSCHGGVESTVLGPNALNLHSGLASKYSCLKNTKWFVPWKSSQFSAMGGQGKALRRINVCNHFCLAVPRRVLRPLSNHSCDTIGSCSPGTPHPGDECVSWFPHQWEREPRMQLPSSSIPACPSYRRWEICCQVWLTSHRSQTCLGKDKLTDGHHRYRVHV